MFFYSMMFDPTVSISPKYLAPVPLQRCVQGRNTALAKDVFMRSAQKAPVLFAGSSQADKKLPPALKPEPLIVATEWESVFKKMLPGEAVTIGLDPKKSLIAPPPLGFWASKHKKAARKLLQLAPKQLQLKRLSDWTWEVTHLGDGRTSKQNTTYIEEITACPANKLVECHPGDEILLGLTNPYRFVLPVMAGTPGASSSASGKYVEQVLSELKEGERFNFGNEEQGSDPDLGFAKLPSVVDSPHVSILRRNNRYWVKDLGSIYGTQRARKILLEPNQPVVIHAEQRIWVDSLHYLDLEHTNPGNSMTLELLAIAGLKVGDFKTLGRYQEKPYPPPEKNTPETTKEVPTDLDNAGPDYPGFEVTTWTPAAETAEPPNHHVSETKDPFATHIALKGVTPYAHGKHLDVMRDDDRLKISLIHPQTPVAETTVTSLKTIPLPQNATHQRKSEKKPIGSALSSTSLSLVLKPDGASANIIIDPPEASGGLFSSRRHYGKTQITLYPFGTDPATISAPLSARLASLKDGESLEVGTGKLWKPWTKTFWHQESYFRYQDDSLNSDLAMGARQFRVTRQGDAYQIENLNPKQKMVLEQIVPLVHEEWTTLNPGDTVKVRGSELFRFPGFLPTFLG
ncbi:MAG: hypothetical protein K2X01_03995 [Cyanobacteria bacterium]|nr:hypothetical protein [Cyanobacteriota bacterium]